ncbi:GNAT family N-acetyltransferase [candidate division GN15 bacterium]|nr:GNAT family N-acetyltransferase [candidate division GN15 bacterium]
MQVEKIIIDDLPAELSARLDSGAFMSSIRFARVWRVIGGQPVCWVAKDGDQIAAALVGVEFGRPPFARFQAMPDGCYGSVETLQGNALEIDTVSSLISGLARGGYLRAYFTDYHHQLREISGLSSELQSTLLVDIDRGDWLPPDKKLQSEFRKAVREGVRVQSVDLDRHFDGFWKLVEHTESRHGRRPKYPPEFYRELAALSARDERIVWRYVEHDGKPAASHIYFVEGGQLMHWQGYFDKSQAAMKPNQYIMVQTVQEAFNRGVRTLNMGTGPTEASALIAYKKKWGGREYSYPTYVMQSWLGRFL